MRLLLDTNVLITGIFEPKSFSRALLEGSRTDGNHYYIGRVCYDEAINVLRRAAQNTGVDLTGVFTRSIEKINFFIIDGSSSQDQNFSKIKGQADRQLTVLAEKNNCAICTNDIEDFSAARERGVHVLTPEDALSDDSKGINSIAKGFLATRERGSAYFHINDPNRQWDSGVPVDGHIDLFRWEELGKLTSNTKTHRLKFKHIDGSEIKTNKIKKKKFFTESGIHAVFSYDCNLGYCVQLGYMGSRKCRLHKWSPYKIQKSSQIHLIEMTVPVLLSVAVFLPAPLSEKGCNNLVTGKAVSAPYERRSLEEIIADYYC